METKLVDCSTHGFIYSQSNTCPFCQTSNGKIEIGSRIKNLLKSAPVKLFPEKIYFAEPELRFSVNIIQSHNQ